MSTMQRGLVSTIIPVFNRPEMIVSAVESVLAQTYRPVEVIIVDDGSNDSTPEVVANLAKLYQEVISLRQANAGPGVARELGRLYVRGEYVQYLDSDDQLLPEKFSLQVNALIQNPDCDVAYGKTDHQDIDSISEMCALKSTGAKITSMFPSFLETRWWSTSTPLFRRSVTDKAGPWLPLINEEDWEYDCRIASLGGRLIYVNEFVSVTYSHDNHLSVKGTIDVNKLRDRCIAREKMYLSAKKSIVAIPDETMNFFSKSVFLLARECAAQNLVECVERMLVLANKARGKKTVKQVIFTMLGKILGWPIAAKIAETVQ